MTQPKTPSSSPDRIFAPRKSKGYDLSVAATALRTASEAWGLAMLRARREGGEGCAAVPRAAPLPPTQPSGPGPTTARGAGASHPGTCRNIPNPPPPRQIPLVCWRGGGGGDGDVLPPPDHTLGLGEGAPPSLGAGGVGYCCCIPPGWQGVQGSAPPGEPDGLGSLWRFWCHGSPGRAGCALQSISCSGGQEHLCKGHGAGQLGLGALPGKGERHSCPSLSPPCLRGETAGSPGSEKPGSRNGHSLEQAHAGRGTQVERGARLLLLGHVSKSLVQAGHQACPCGRRVGAVAGNAGTCGEETALPRWVGNARWAALPLPGCSEGGCCRFLWAWSHPASCHISLRAPRPPLADDPGKVGRWRVETGMVCWWLGAGRGRAAARGAERGDRQRWGAELEPVEHLTREYAGRQLGRRAVPVPCLRPARQVLPPASSPRGRGHPYPARRTRCAR